MDRSSSLSDSRHTKGPWRYDPSAHAIVADVPPGWADPEDEYHPTTTTVAHLRGAMGGEDSSADALMLAAGPTLLEALLAIVRTVQEHDDKMDYAAHDGREARPPDGDDYNEIYGIVMGIGLPALNAVKSSQT